MPGLEGEGLPEAWRSRTLAIPIRPEVESLNAAAAVAVALYAWSVSKARRGCCPIRATERRPACALIVSAAS